MQKKKKTDGQTAKVFFLKGTKQSLDLKRDPHPWYVSQRCVTENVLACVVSRKGKNSYQSLSGVAWGSYFSLTSVSLI